MKAPAIALITLYQRAVSPFLVSSCRYSPTCSQYSREAIERYDSIKGTWLTIKRMARCRPMGGRGYDPVP